MSASASTQDRIFEAALALGPVAPSRQQQLQPSAPATDATAEFLRLVFRGQESGFAVVYPLPAQRSEFFDLTDPDWISRATAAAHRLRDTQNVYIGTCSQQEIPPLKNGKRGRGGAATALAVPGMWADIDILGPQHASPDLPPTVDDALELIGAVPFAPTLIVRSGYGLQPWWLFREPLEIHSDADRQFAAGLAVSFLGYLTAAARQRGWKVDPTGDLARVLRLPGTFNRKSSDPVLVTYELTPGEPRYNPSEFEEFLSAQAPPDTRAPRPAGTSGPADLGADFGLITQGCSWLRHCVRDAATLPEPEWYRALAVAGRCRGGDQIAHEISRAYPKYSASETDRKLAQARTASNAPLCTYIAGHFDGTGQHCGSCPSRGRVNSPVGLGYLKRAAAPVPTARPTTPPADPAEPPPFESDPDPVDADAPPREDPLGVAPQDWRRLLIPNREGAPRALLANAVIALTYAEDMRDALAFSDFSLDVIAVKRTPWGSIGKWSDNDGTRAACWLQHEHGIFVSSTVAGEAAATVAKERSFHPVREYLESLRWDGTPRIEQWLTPYLGVENTPYSRAVGSRWLISAVARVFKPGAKVDCCLILEGKQGLKKSTALKTIAGEQFFTDELADLGSKDAAMQTRGIWVIELAELDSMSRSEVGGVKAFMSRSADRFRPPYGRTLIDSPRQCVFAGTVNHSTYLRDETGGRRFWPVTCTYEAKIDELARARDQLWAEAVVRYRQGARWWLDTAELNEAAEQEQMDRYEGDAWEELIAKWLPDPVARYDEHGHPLQPFTSNATSVTVADVLIHCIAKRPDQWAQAEKNRVARSLTALGWERYQVRSGLQREWRYRRAK